MLELNYEAVRCLDVGYVFFAGDRVGVANFLPVHWEIVLPGTMPFGLILPPWVAVPPSLVRPMPDLDAPAFCDHALAAVQALSGLSRFWFLLRTVNKGEFHYCQLYCSTTE